MTPLFIDRKDAGVQLTARLGHYREHQSAVVLALPRGGAPVAHEVANALGLPLSVHPVKKLRVSDKEELAVGAIASGGACFVDQKILQNFNISEKAVQAVREQQAEELRRLESVYRRHIPGINLRNRCAIVVDDGVATGSTMRAAVEAIKHLGAKKVVVAVPVSSPQAACQLSPLVDEFICIATPAPAPFVAIQGWYENFAAPSDADICRLLASTYYPSPTQGEFACL